MLAIKKSCVSLFLVAVLAFGGCAHHAGHHTDSETPLTIVVAEDADAPTAYAAEELRDHLEAMVGVAPHIESPEARTRGLVLVVGQNDLSDRLLGHPDWAALGPEESFLKTKGRHLVLAGGAPRGTLYAVYALLQDHLGVRWFTPEITHIPEMETFILPELDEHIVPVLEYREAFTLDGFDGDWAARNRVNGNSMRLEEKHGGKIQYHGFVHTFEQLVPPGEFFETHPEYFSLIDGERVGERSQLCLTNPDVERIIIERIRERMIQHPEATVFSVSQNDWYNYCECAACTALAEAEESQMGPMLKLVNAVARAVAEDFPDKAIDTLAYQYTRKPPKRLRPEPNVIIRLCSIECCFSHPLATCNSEENRAFVADMEAWSEISDRLWVWDYVTSFAHYFTPFPNHHVRKPNIQFFVDHNVTGIFEQDVYTTLNGELSPLSAYMNARLLWNPEADDEALKMEFLEGVYSFAAPHIAQYIQLLEDKVNRDNIHMDIWIGPGESPFLTDEILAEADRLWDMAEAAVIADAETHERVRIARLSVDYALIDRYLHDIENAWQADHQKGNIAPGSYLADKVHSFFEVAEAAGVTNIREWDGALSKYKEQTLADITPRHAGMLAAARPAPDAGSAAWLPGLRFASYLGAWKSLPDFSALPAHAHAHGLAERVSLDPKPEGAEAYGLRFTGYIHAPEKGLYSFSLGSNDGSRLYLHDKLIVNNDGEHKFQRRAGHMGLEAGLHPIVIEYFQAGAAEGLDLKITGPATPAQWFYATSRVEEKTHEFSCPL